MENGILVRFWQMKMIIGNYFFRRICSITLATWFLFLLLSHYSFSFESSELDLSKPFNPSKFETILASEELKNRAVVGFYTNRSFKPFWYGHNERINDFCRVIDRSFSHGLPNKKYELLFKNKELSPYELEILMMESFTLLVSDLKSGVLSPSEVDNAISVYPQEINLDSVFARLEKLDTETDRLEDFIFSFAPDDLEYDKLLTELDRLRDIARKNQWGSSVPEEKFLGYNLNHPNVGSLRSRLFKMGYLTFDSGSNLYDEEVKSAVQLFQADHGLNDDGVAGSYTLQAINVSPQTRLIQILVNLERLRWNDFKEESKYIIVNQPNFQAYLVEDDRVVWQSRVVIGLPEHQTQEFSDVMTHIIINPVWHVPRSISITEYLPIIQDDPKFLEENDMSLIVRGTDRKIDPSLIDMDQFEPDNFPFMIKQNPSNINALGVVKFMFPNEFNIYMHDTPMKELFFKDERTFSHGCVRVQDPFQFAFNLLGYQESDPQKKFQQFLQTKEESQINLVEPIPVNLVYRTVFFSDYGQPQYRSDVYGRDAAVFMALQDAGVITQI